MEELPAIVDNFNDIRLGYVLQSGKGRDGKKKGKGGLYGLRTYPLYEDDVNALDKHLGGDQKQKHDEVIHLVPSPSPFQNLPPTTIHPKSTSA